ncbi:GTPase family protein [Leptospira interrogans]
MTTASKDARDMTSWMDRSRGLFSRYWNDVWAAVMNPAAGAREAQAIKTTAQHAATVVWLVGKVQSGKTSIVRALTGASQAEVGSGFAPCTRTSRVFDFPAEAPVIRFLDTRGLGETNYDPTEDLAFAEGQAHLMLVVMRALDPQQDAIVSLVRDVRNRRPDWPVVVAQTSLHDAYKAGENHRPSYPFDEDGLPDTRAVPPELVRGLAYQRGLFKDLPGDGAILFVPIDFTQSGDGYEPQFYGLDALLEDLKIAAPAGLVAALELVHSADNDARSVQAHPHIVGYATAAAAADVVPLAGLVAVPGVQAKMLHSLAEIYGVEWDRRTIGEFASCFGTATIVRAAGQLGIRQLMKLIPVYGQTAGAVAASAASFATTFALGKAACYFLARRRAGETDMAGVSRTYSEALAEAFKLARRPVTSQPEGGQAGA